MKKIKQLTLLILCSYCIHMNSQISKVWEKRYQSSLGNNETVIDSQTDTLGNTFVLGSVFNPTGSWNTAIMKYNSSGNRDWIQFYDTAYSDRPIDLVVDKFGNSYVIGVSGTSVGAESKYFILKYDFTGNLLWHKQYNLNSYNFPPVKAVMRNNNVVVAFYNFFTIEFDFSGLAISNSNVPTYATYSTLKNLYVDKSNQVYDLGTISTLLGGGNYYAFIQKIGGNASYYLTSGNSDFFKNYATHMTTNAMGNEVYVSSHAGNSSTSELIGETVISKLNVGAPNPTIWEYSIFGTSINGWHRTADMETDNQGNVIILSTIENTATNLDIRLTKLTNSGALVWQKTYNNPNNSEDIASDMVIDANSNIYITGTTKNSTGTSDFITRKYDAAGNLLWDIRYNGNINENDNALRIGKDYLNNIYVSGNSTDSTLYQSMMTVKYSCFLTNAPDSFIVKNTSLCANSSNILYSVSSQTNANSYTWTYSGSGVTFSGTSFSTTANFLNTATSGTINVYANNSCGMSATPLSLNINVIAAPTVSLSSFASVCLNSPTLALTGGLPSGGTYTGVGVSAGVFNPSVAGVGTKNITYTYTDATTSCSNFSTKTIAVSACTGIEELTNNPLTIVFPNPSSTQWNVTLNNAEVNYKELVLTDVTGKVVWSSEINETQATTIVIPNTNLANGLYFLKTISKQGVEIQKLIKD